MPLTLEERQQAQAAETIQAASVQAFDAIVGRLSNQSVEKHFDAYADVDWDSPELRVDPSDSRWELWEFDPLGRTAWYQAQPPEVRARMGLHRIAVSMRTGWEFENVLQRGLLGFVYRLGNQRPEFRYLHHEIIEESQHTLMFQELINRTGLPVRGLPRPLKRLAELFVIPLNHRFPPLFFLFVLGGEDPIDHVQRLRLRTGGVAHPLVERIMRIHVTEEARHLSFARHYLRTRVPRLGWPRRQVLSIAAPLLLGNMARLMLRPSRAFARTYEIPRTVLREANRSPESHALERDSVAKVRRLCADLGLMNPVSRALWRVMGIWGETAPPTGSSPTA